MSRFQHQRDPATFLVYPDEIIHQIILLLLGDVRRRRGHGLPLLLPLAEGAVHQLVGCPVARLAAALRAADGAGEPRRREQVVEAEPGGDLDDFREELEEVLTPLEPLPDHGAHRRVRDDHLDPLGQVHGLSRRRRGDGGD
ncbi:hypothetical protein EE612_009354 [Oryza sativa]|nr:hypothetical protein EE612_009354 [Oryza sativa]